MKVKHHFVNGCPNVLANTFANAFGPRREAGQLPDTGNHSLTSTALSPKHRQPVWRSLRILHKLEGFWAQQVVVQDPVTGALVGNAKATEMVLRIQRNSIAAYNSQKKDTMFNTARMRAASGVSNRARRNRGASGGGAGGGATAHTISRDTVNLRP